MNTIYIIAATGFADRLSGLLWQAYGKPLKIVACIILAVMIIGPLVAFIQRIIR